MPQWFYTLASLFLQKHLYKLLPLHRSFLYLQLVTRYGFHKENFGNENRPQLDEAFLHFCVYGILYFSFWFLWWISLLAPIFYSSLCPNFSLCNILARAVDVVCSSPLLAFEPGDALANEILPDIKSAGTLKLLLQLDFPYRKNILVSPLVMKRNETWRPDSTLMCS